MVSSWWIKALVDSRYLSFSLRLRPWLWDKSHIEINLYQTTVNYNKPRRLYVYLVLCCLVHPKKYVRGWLFYMFCRGLYHPTLTYDLGLQHCPWGNNAISDRRIAQFKRRIMTSSNGNIFRVTGPLCGEFTGHWWIPLKASDAQLWCFVWSAPWINGWVNNREAGNLRRHGAHYDVILMATRNDMGE